MKHISDLSGIGRGLTCAIIGGGLSVRQLDLEQIYEDCEVITINLHALKFSDILIYYDETIKNILDGMDYRPSQFLIGHKHGKIDNTSKNCSHYYGYYDCKHGDTGFRALQFASELFGYKKIYLAGFDYCHDGKSYHFEEKESDPNNLYRFSKYSIDVILPLYEQLELSAQVYNLSPISKIKKFPYYNGYLLTKKE